MPPACYILLTPCGPPANHGDLRTAFWEMLRPRRDSNPCCCRLMGIFKKYIDIEIRAIPL